MILQIDRDKYIARGGSFIRIKIYVYTIYIFRFTIRTLPQGNIDEGCTHIVTLGTDVLGLLDSFFH